MVPKFRILEWNWIVERIKKPESKILDVGCAEQIRGGNVQDLTVQLIRRGHFITGMDIQSLNFTHERFIFIKANILEYEWPPKTFDYVIASHVLQHLGLEYWGLNKVYDDMGDRKFIDKVYRWLKPEGILFLVIPFGGTFKFIKYRNCKYRLYDMTTLESLFNKRFKIVDKIIINEVSPSRENATSIVLEVKKSNVA